ncbi:MAG TPA: copper resistance CopC family protein [Methylosinus sp.]|uniref:copper resistance CopC family protein n=1 Tax=Methylosinus sp. TaxID=427 RepID=UPI002F91CC66
MISRAAAPDRNHCRPAIARPSLARGCALFLLCSAIGGATPTSAREGGAEPPAARILPHFAGPSAIGLLGPSQPPPRAERPILLAHAIVVRTSPAQDGVAVGNIGKVDVWYDAGIRDAFAALAVISASGERVDKRDAAIDRSDPAHVSVSVDPLTPGKYKVRYRALSADGHLVSGAWDFDVLP